MEIIDQDTSIPVTMEEAEVLYSQYHVPKGYVVLCNKTISKRTPAGLLKDAGSMSHELLNMAKNGFLVFRIHEETAVEKGIKQGDYAILAAWAIGEPPLMMFSDNKIDMRIVDATYICGICNH